MLEKLVAPEIGNKIADVSFLDAGGVDNIKYPYYLLKELGIPFITIVDRDYFFPYFNNNELESSRSQSTGLPFYSYVIKNDDVLKDIFKTEIDKHRLVENHRNGYRKFFEYIKQYRILSMNYCLEMDLTCSSKARDEYYKLLNTISVNRNQKFLLEKNGKAIKKIDKILSIIDTIPQRSYPESYLKIRNTLIDDINRFIQ